MKTQILLLAIVTAVNAFTGDERFVKKYAMMKVYESCFGPEVVKEVRMEMQMAASKCSVLTGHTSSSPSLNSLSLSQKHSSKLPHDKNSIINGAHIKTTNQVHKLSNKQDSLALAASNTPLVLSSDDLPAPSKTHPTIDLEKLQEAILAGYSKPAAAQGSYPVATNPAASSPPMYQPYQGYSSGRPAPYYPPPAPYYPPPYQPPQYAPNPAYYQQPMYQPSYPNYYPGRSSRDLDVKGQLETLATRMSGRIQNITCVMQELGYLDANMDPDYARMLERIGRLPVAEELKRDMAEGVEFCRRFSQCLPNDKKDKLVRDMVKPMFFFRCYKHKKLEACIMKDVRERYNGSEELTEENLTSDARSAKVFPEDMGTAVYEFLYGDGNVDLDSFF